MWPTPRSDDSVCALKTTSVEGKCVLIEFKEPREDLSDHLQQLIKYGGLIANYAVSKIDKFHCYLIGENISRVDLGGDFSTTVNGDWIRDPIRIMSPDYAVASVVMSLL